MTYPVTIIKTRYKGVYEHGRWAAFNLRPESVPGSVMGSDIECATWWDHFRAGVGLGETPDLALAALEQIEEPLHQVWDEKLSQLVLTQAPKDVRTLKS